MPFYKFEGSLNVNSFNTCEEPVMELALGNINFWLASRKENVNTTADSLAIRSGVEDIADELTILERRVIYQVTLVVTWVS